MRPALVAKALILSQALAGAALADLVPRCQQAPVWRDHAARTIELGRIWSGVRTAVGALEVAPGVLLASFYDEGRRLVLVRADAQTGHVCEIRFDSVFSGWDAHNSIVMAQSLDGTVHIAGNAHASALFYASGRADDLSSFRADSLIGQDETNATYPTFLRSYQGHQLFIYRDGSSGKGTWLANVWRNGTWHRLGEIFASHDSEGRHVSAYPSAIVTDKDGINHVAIVWRRSRDVATNYRVTYARTHDFRSWSGMSGKPKVGPIGPEDGDIVEDTGMGRGLLNSARILLADDRPLIFYTRFSEDERDVLVVASPGLSWIPLEIAQSDRATLIAGGGSIEQVPRFTVAPVLGGVNIVVKFVGHAHDSFRLNTETLARMQPLKAPAPVFSCDRQLDIGPPPTLPDASVIRMEVRGGGDDVVGQLCWYAQDHNRDRPRECTSEAPQACDPPASRLVWTSAGNQTH